MRRVDRRTNALPHRQTDRPTDTASYRGALSHLKRVYVILARRLHQKLLHAPGLHDHQMGTTCGNQRKANEAQIEAVTATGEPECRPWETPLRESRRNTRQRTKKSKMTAKETAAAATNCDCYRGVSRSRVIRRVRNSGTRRFRGKSG